MRAPTRLALLAAMPLAVASCTVKLDPAPDGSPPPQAKNLLSTGFTGDLDWDLADGGVNGVGTGADGQGGIAIGGKFFGATVEAWLADGELLGSAPTDATTGLVTAKPSPTYTGWLHVVVKGTASATIHDEGLDAAVPFPEGRVLHAWVPILRRNVGVTAFTEAAHQVLTAGSTPERVDGVPTAAQLQAANDRVRGVLNAFLPASLQLDDLTRLPGQRNAKNAAGSLGSDARGRYALVEGALTKLAQRANGASTSPGLDATDELAEDLKDGRLDGLNGTLPAAPADRRAYEPGAFGTELVSGLAQQVERYGKAEVTQKLPPLVSFGNTRYQGYLFDGSVTSGGQAYSTVAGWVAGNALGKQPGNTDQKVSFVTRTAGLFANMGHGGGYFKADAASGTPRIYALGDNVNGELGLGNRSSTGGSGIELTTLPAGATLTFAAGGFAHTVARLADGTVWAWGDNAYGQLGQGKTGAELRRSTTPLQVTLPAKALTVGATTVASYALLADGTVWAWGSEAGYGLLGDGLRNGRSTSPAKVPGLAGVTQLAARDLDVAVVKADGTVWQWGSFPAPDPAFVAHDPSLPYTGGNLVPTQITGFPAGVGIRKLLTEQAVFAALLDDGQVWAWGVHFDMTAGMVLRDLTPVRVLGLPPLRDLLPGGYIGYGLRAFDRLTGLGVDYAGGYWKVRGRVAEAFDPANPASQHRPQGQGPRVDCIACHQYLDRPLVEYQALAPSTTGLPACQIPPGIHEGPLGYLIRAETVCVQCHNPARIDYPITTPDGKQPFQASGAWPSCAPPAGLVPRGFVDPPLITDPCTIPPRHTFTPPGTVCATCHQSVLARPLNTMVPTCAQPSSGLLPTLETTATVTGATDAAALPIPPGGLVATRAPVIYGSLSAPLDSGESLEVSRSGAVAGTANATGTAWTFTDAAPADGTFTYTARVVSGVDFGATSNGFTFSIDATPPAQLAAITGFQDDLLGAVTPGGFGTDTTPVVNGTLTAGLAADEALQVLRDGSLVGSATVSGTGWTYAEAAALTLAAHAYAARVIDLAGNVGASSPAATYTAVGALPGASITHVTAGGAPLASGASTTSRTLVVSGTLTAALQPGYALRIRRNGVDAGAAAATGTTWSFTDSSLADGTYAWTARVEAGLVLGNFSGPWSATVDTVPPAQVANVTGIADDFNGALADGATTADPTPLVSGTLSAALGAGEQVQVLRGGVAVATVAASGLTFGFAEPTSLANGTYAYTARVLDAAGQLGPASGASRSVVVNTSSVPLIGAATTLATIDGVAPVNSAVALNNVRTPVLAGTLQRALVAGEVVKVYRDNVAVGNGTVTTTSWTFTSASLADGTYAFRARIEQAANAAVFGLTSASVSDPIDGTAPTQGATISTIYDDSGALAVRTDTYSTDVTPRIDGTLTAALAATDYLRLTRDGVEIAKLRPAGTTWSYVEPAAVALGSHAYGADVRDDAGNGGTAAASPTHTVNLILATSLPNATITSAAVSGTGSPTRPNGTVVASGGAIPDTTPTLTVTLAAALPAGYQVEVLRDGAQAGTPLSTCASPCTFTDSGATQGLHAYTVHTLAGPIAGTASGTYSLTVDTVAPAQTITLNQVRSDFAPTTAPAGATNPASNLIANGGNTDDATPIFRFTLSGALGAGESISLRRGTTPLVVTPSNVCGANCYEASLDTGLTVVDTTSTALPAYNPASPALQPVSGSPVSFNIRVVDAAGNEGTATAAFTVNVGYFRCDQARADAAYLAVNGINHSTISFAGNTLASCIGCHAQPTAPGHPVGGATPAGFFVAVPATPSAVERYWCGRPP
ncbi:MAG: hypothetical protein QM704_08545 [Anaeromyxobacteraceae bacterium]